MKRRYEIEHRILPQQFEAYPGMVVSFLLKGPEAFADWLKDLYEQVGEPFPYQASDYRIDYFQLEEGIFMIGLGLPQPEEPPLCWSINLIFEAGFAWQEYFTLERGLDTTHLCSWKDGSHRNHGHAPTGHEAVIAACLKLAKSHAKS